MPAYFNIFVDKIAGYHSSRVFWTIRKAPRKSVEKAGTSLNFFRRNSNFGKLATLLIHSELMGGNCDFNVIPLRLERLNTS